MGTKKACRRRPARRRKCMGGDHAGASEAGLLLRELLARRASGWAGASDLGASPSFIQCLLSTSLGPCLQELCHLPPTLFANKRMERGACLPSNPAFFPSSCFLSLPLSLRADAVNWSVLKVHINTQRAKETSWQRNIIITS